MKCPTCPKAKENCCCQCGSKYLKNETMELQPDPYGEEIAGDDSLHLQCATCNYSSAMDI